MFLNVHLVKKQFLYKDIEIPSNGGIQNVHEVADYVKLVLKNGITRKQSKIL